MSDRLYAATRKGLFSLHDGASGWTISRPAFAGEPVTAILVDSRTGTMYAALRLGHFGVKLHRSEDGGESWTEVRAPAFPTEPGSEETAPSVDMIWTLAEGGADAPDTILAGTLPAALFVSRDRGESWSLVEGLWNVPERKDWNGGGYDLPGLHSIVADPRDPHRLTVGISTGGVWQSDDFGESWTLVGAGLRAEYMPPNQAYDLVFQDVHRLARCRAAPDVMWCQHHNGIFRSADGGRTFSEIRNVEPSVFGFAVAAHPEDPDIAWFVPAVKDECRIPVGGRLVVTRTHDGGQTFEALGNGLPAEHCYDLIYRHALTVDDTGSGLAMGSTTGNLWASRDGGESWRRADANLPPIAQVTFG